MTINELIADEMRKRGVPEEIIKAAEQKFYKSFPVLCAEDNRELSPHVEALIRRDVEVLLSMPREAVTGLW